MILGTVGPTGLGGTIFAALGIALTIGCEAGVASGLEPSADDEEDEAAGSPGPGGFALAACSRTSGASLIVFIRRKLLAIQAQEIGEHAVWISWGSKPNPI